MNESIQILCLITAIFIALIVVGMAVATTIKVFIMLYKEWREKHG